MVRSLQKPRRIGGIVALIIGSTISLAAVVLAILVWMVLLPALRSGGPPEFSPECSHLGLWNEKRRLLALGIWTHDDGFLVGNFGGKEWVEPLIKSMVTGKGYGYFGGYRDAALEGITNHSPPEGSNVGVYWPEWWTSSKDQTQSEWIRRGFEKDGFEIALPPNPGDWPVLLRILGEKRDRTPKESEKQHLDEADFANPRRARYNAFRWLRDSGFDPVLYLVERDGSIDSSRKEGLLAYRDFEKEFRTAVPGRLDFAQTDNWGTGMPLSLRPKIFDPLNQGIIAAVLAGFFLLGAGIARWGRTSSDPRRSADRGQKD